MTRGVATTPHRGYLPLYYLALVPSHDMITRGSSQQYVLIRVMHDVDLL